jgi:hypothetical protein
MDPAARIRMIREIVAALAPNDWSDIDLVLGQFGFPITDTWPTNSRQAYVQAMVERASPEELTGLHSFLYNDQPGDGRAPAEDLFPEIWKPQFFVGERFFRMFISHTSQHKVEVAALKAALAGRGVAGFVAHEDISPTDEWVRVIESALAGCDALLAYLTPDFKGSNWTDQEVGIAVGRGKLILPVRVGADPHGFVGKWQAIQGQGLDPHRLAKRVVEIVQAHPLSRQRYAEAMIERFCNAGSYDDARKTYRTITNIPKELWTPELAQQVRAAITTNGELINGLVGNTTVAMAANDFLTNLGL